MTTIEPTVKTTDDLLLWLLGYFSQKFRNRAILRGGMILRMLNSPRATNDLDLVFVPFSSKKDILPEIERALAGIEHISYTIKIDSKCIHCLIRYGALQVQLEATVSTSCAKESISSNSQGTPYLLAIQRRDVALAHKIAAWNERGLMRDLYDIYFFVCVLGVLPHLPTLQNRLQNVFAARSNRSKPMKMNELVAKLEQAHSHLNKKSLDAELGAFLTKEECEGLDLKIKVALHQLTHALRLESP